MIKLVGTLTHIAVVSAIAVYAEQIIRLGTFMVVLWLTLKVACGLSNR